MHVCLHVLILAFPITGFVTATPGNESVDVYGFTLQHFSLRAGAPAFWRRMHNAILPLVSTP